MQIDDLLIMVEMHTYQQDLIDSSHRTFQFTLSESDDVVRSAQTLTPDQCRKGGVTPSSIPKAFRVFYGPRVEQETVQ